MDIAGARGWGAKSREGLCRLLQGERGRDTPLAAPAPRLPRQRLPREHRALAILSPLISAEGAVLAQHVVARDEPRHRVATPPRPPRPGPPRHAHGARERRVSGRPGGAE